PDVKDACPSEPENFNGYLDWDGCPDVKAAESTTTTRPDTDKDGIPDDVDQCPYAPETWNKYRDDDGCPDTSPEQQRFLHDDDLDGIINDTDMCPLVPEDYLGIIDGCPNS
ncbi:MAG: thrombospondin type 3 repeat-containing protein, partial [Nitrosarchaeum sp.]